MNCKQLSFWILHPGTTKICVAVQFSNNTSIRSGGVHCLPFHFSLPHPSCHSACLYNHLFASFPVPLSLYRSLDSAVLIVWCANRIPKHAHTHMDTMQLDLCICDICVLRGWLLFSYACHDQFDWPTSPLPPHSRPFWTALLLLSLIIFHHCEPVRPAIVPSEFAPLFLTVEKVSRIYLALFISLSQVFVMIPFMMNSIVCLLMYSFLATDNRKTIQWVHRKNWE